MKRCPFCAEEIQDAAIKCRFCGSPLTAEARSNALAPITIYDGTPSWKAFFWSYVAAGVLSIALVGLVWIAILNAKRKSLHFKITDHAIDYEQGWLSKKIETMQLFRVRDLDFRQSAFDRLLGIAHIHLFTSDKTDPDLTLVGLPASREIFDKLKSAIEAARQQRVMGVERDG